MFSPYASAKEEFSFHVNLMDNKVFWLWISHLFYLRKKCLTSWVVQSCTKLTNRSGAAARGMSQLKTNTDPNGLFGNHSCTETWRRHKWHINFSSTLMPPLVRHCQLLINYHNFNKYFGSLFSFMQERWWHEAMFSVVNTARPISTWYWPITAISESL